MNDNFEFEKEKTEESAQNETYINDNNLLEDELLGENPSQAINIPITAPEERVSNKGIKIFCGVLALIILLTGSSFFGYYIGKNTGTKNYFKDNELVLNSKPVNTEQSTLEEIYTNNVESVVGILAYNSQGQMSEASGVVYTEDGYIITNDHIYSGIPSARFKIYDASGSEYNAVYVAGDTRSDLAVLKITDKVKLKPAVFGNSDEVLFGESVCAIGCPNGYSAKAIITAGIVSVPKVRQSITSSYSCNFIQTDTPINPGNSGGALFNMYGQVIGITSSKIASTSYEGIGYAIPSVTVNKVVESLIKNGRVVNRARLGVSYTFYNSALSEINKLADHGLLIAEVSIDSDLNGKVAKNDIITKVNDIEISDDAIILDIIEESKPGDTLFLTIVTSKGNTINVSAKLLEDEGSTSYTDKITDSSNNSSHHNNGIFDFPEGY